MIETLRDARGAVWFMEFNGRPWGSLALSRRQGFEYASWNTQLALDPNWQLSKQPQIKRNLVCRNLGRELMHLLFVLRGPKSKALTEWPGFFKSFVDVTWVKREHSFYNWRKDDLKVFAFDCCYTLRENLFKVRHS